MSARALTDYKGRVLITGASGFVGGYLLRRLAEDGLDLSQLHVLTQSGAAPQFTGLRGVQGDVQDRAQMRQVIAEIAPAAVIHLAAIALPAGAEREPDRAWRVNLDGVRFIADAILQDAPDCRLLFSGSAEAYGATFNDYAEPVPEAAALKPISTYGATKAAADLVLGQLAWRGLKAVRFRAFNHTGPGQSAQYVVASFAEQVARIEAGLQPPVLRVGNLNAARDFLDVRDVVRAYSLALTADLDFQRAPVFNIASGQSRTIASILDGILARSVAKIEVEVDPARLRPSEVAVASGSPKAIAEALGWAPTIDFDKVLEHTLEASRAVVGAGNEAGSD